MLTPKILVACVFTCARLLAALLLVTTAAHAGFTISGARVIYEEAQGEAIVHVRHSVGETPALMQAWLDDGNPQFRPGQQNLPFVLNPAVAMMTPGSEQIIRVLRMGQLPADRESLLFFNILEVPQQSSATPDESFVRFATQARLKFFYRPQGLRPAAGQAADMLHFVAEPRADGKLALRVKNPTPYHITFVGMTLHASGADKTPALAGLDTGVELAPMIAPYSELVVRLKPVSSGQLRLNAQTRVRYTIINDLGGKNTKMGKLE